jgi:hypothetical protein
MRREISATKPEVIPVSAVASDQIVSPIASVR